MDGNHSTPHFTPHRDCDQRRLVATTGDSLRSLKPDINGLTGHVETPCDTWRKIGGGRDWIRTSVAVKREIYSLVDLTTLPPFHADLEPDEATA